MTAVMWPTTSTETMETFWHCYSIGHGGNSILDEHFNSCAGNVIYTSKTIQNELIMICSHLIRGLILEEVREA